MLDRNTIIAFLLIAVILIFVPYYSEWVNPATAEIATDTIMTANPRSESSQTAPQVEKNSTVAPSLIKEVILPKNRSGEKELTLIADKYALTLSNLGGGTVKQIQLFEYDDAHGNPVTLLKPNAKGNLDIALQYGGYRDSLTFSEIPFASSNFDLYEDGGTISIKGKYTVDFQLTLPTGETLTKSFIFYEDDYHFDMTLRFENFHNKIPDLMYDLTWNSPFAITEKNTIDDLTYSYLYAMVGQELVELQYKDKPASIRTPGDVNWVSVRGKYFHTSIIPIDKKGTVAQLDGFRTKTERFGHIRMSMKFNNNLLQEDKFTIVLGPLDDTYLSHFGIGLEKIMNWGWKIIQPISVGILYSLKFMHRFIPNYGIVLIIFSIIIKLLLYPLTHKSYESMKKMQEIQPLMKELQDKHKNNPQQLNKEMMGLYKKYKVNPAGGCLPMMLQMPLLYALFIVFRTTIELRHAPLGGWITDLSSPDVIFTLPFSIPMYGAGVAVLPILMAVTMIFQQKLTGTAQSNPQQKYMMYLMPVFFLLLFNNFPSGLNLYYTLFNILTILQQKYFINPSIKLEPTETTSKKKK